MRFLLDENVQVRVGNRLQKAAHDVARVPSGMRNGAVLVHAVSERRVLVTYDSDFLDSVRYPPARTPGIVYVRVHPASLDGAMRALERLMETVPATELAGACFMATEDESRRVQ